VLASDAHDAVRRAPHLRSELERGGLDQQQIDYFARLVPEAIVTGAPLPPAPPMPQGRGRRVLRRSNR
jgi:hypothetical protein